MDQTERPQYYEGEYLGAEDLSASVGYARVGQARHALGAHTWGIALGLELVESPLPSGDVQVTLTPGYAWDGIGRPIVVLAPVKLDQTLFASLQGGTTPAGVPVEIWLSYHEVPTQSPASGFAACREGQLYKRVAESYRIEALRPPIDNTHSVIVAGRAIDPMRAVVGFNPLAQPLYDESVPYQQFPESGDDPLWRIFVGFVRWVNLSNAVGRFIARTDADLNEARKRRRYIGVVAETIQAADGVLRLRDRANDPADAIVAFTPPVPKPQQNPPPDKDLVWVEGNLRVIGDARLVTGKLDYRLQGGGDGGIPIYLRRVDDTTQNKTTLEAAVGLPPPSAQTRFAVSSLDAAGKATPRLAVIMDTGKVGVGTESPTAQLHLHSTDPTVGARQGDLQLFSQSADVEYDGGSDKLFVVKDTGGTTAFVGGNIGIGSTTPAGKLTVHSDNQLQGDVHLFSTTADFEYDGGSDKLFVFKDTGGTTAFVGGNVGIGTTTPAGTLEVAGRGTTNVDLKVNGRMQTGDAYNNGGVWLDSGSTMFVGQNGTNVGFWRPAVGWDAFQIDPNGNISIGRQTPATTLDISGDMHLNGRAFLADPVVGAVWTTSDRQEKQDIAEIHRPLERLLALKGVSFAWKDPKKPGRSAGRQVGFVAQDVETVFPEWVKDTPWGAKAVNVIGVNALVVEAVRELYDKCTRLEEELAKVNAKVVEGGHREAEHDEHDKPPAPRRPQKR